MTDCAEKSPLGRLYLQWPEIRRRRWTQHTKLGPRPWAAPRWCLWSARTSSESPRHSAIHWPNRTDCLPFGLTWNRDFIREGRARNTAANQWHLCEKREERVRISGRQCMKVLANCPSYAACAPVRKAKFKRAKFIRCSRIRSSCKWARDGKLTASYIPFIVPSLPRAAIRLVLNKNVLFGGFPHDIPSEHDIKTTRWESGNLLSEGWILDAKIKQTFIHPFFFGLFANDDDDKVWEWVDEEGRLCRKPTTFSSPHNY